MCSLKLEPTIHSMKTEFKKALNHVHLYKYMFMFILCNLNTNTHILFTLHDFFKLGTDNIVSLCVLYVQTERISPSVWQNLITISHWPILTKIKYPYLITNLQYTKPRARTNCVADAEEVNAWLGLAMVTCLLWLWDWMYLFGCETPTVRFSFKQCIWDH